YIVVDRYRRLIVGFFVSLDPPSWAGAMRAVLSMFENKKVLCERYGVKYDPEDWVADGLMPARFFADRGSEFVSKNSDLITRNLSVTFTNAKALWAAAKGTVECSFKLVHVEIKREDVGWDPAYNTKIRRPRKTYKSAKLTLPQLRTKLLQAVLAHNRKPHKKYQLSPADIRDGHKPIPRDIFVRGLRTYGRPPVFEYQEVLTSLLCFSPAPRGKARTNENPDYLTSGGAVHADGVRFGGCMYVSTAIRKKGWLLRAKQGDSFSVDVRHDIGLVDHIYVTDPKDTRAYHRLELTTDFKDFKGYQRYEVLNLNAAAKETQFWADEDVKADRVQRIDEEEASKSSGKFKVLKTKVPEKRAQEKVMDRSGERELPPSPHDEAEDDQASNAPDGNVVALHAETAASVSAAHVTAPTAPSSSAPAAHGAQEQAARDRLLARLKGR
ncbi:hypothetical protein ACQUZK_09070, partial [Streptococcus pyogenes]|uniref:hypothetical protein n=1 Tax=Streptococcus pyogenes TaxID=1314 RepID=UPI003DA08201